jgi:sigma-B regulation protein RsbU (phosphoserine phosphatase)
VRPGWIVVAALSVCGALQMPGQAPPPKGPGPLGALLAPHGHSRPRRPKVPEAPPTPEVDFDATHLGSPALLDKNWRVGVTANPQAVAPTFDDSSWSLRDAKPSIADVPDEDHPTGAGPADQGPDDEPKGLPPGHRRPFAWFRLHIKLAPNHGPIAMLVELPVTPNASMYGATGSGSSIDVFANGRHVDPEGPHGEDADHYQSISRIYDLNVPASETSLVLVVRTIYAPFGFSAYTSFFATRTFRIGNPDDLNRSLELWSLHSLFEHLPHLVNEILLVFLALFLLALYFTQRGHREYLWLAFYELAQAPIGFITLAGSTAQLDQLWYAALLVQLLMVTAYLYFEFIISFLALKKRWYIKWLRWTAPVLALIGPALLMVVTVGHSRIIAISVAAITLGCFLWVMGWMAFILITLISATVRRNFEAGLLLVPLLLSFVGVMEPIMTSGMTDWSGKPYRSPLTIQAGPIPIHFAAVADFTGLLAIVLIIFFRFLRIHRDRERASSELAAARSVQELMIPREKIDTPGFEVDSVYNPANEVGGDFFHIENTGDGGLLVVIGDVAGKGLKAAMNVSMLMGALRRTADRHPARILESLNRVLAGSESFTTCQAALFGPNGELVIANAGHLPPYLNSQEVSLPGGLPLGVLPEVTYEEVRLYLHPGDRILLMSDGVVEARQSSGELFGFGRVHNLSNQSAFYIADAAREFGQEDDITVLTVRRLAQAMAA